MTTASADAFVARQPIFDRRLEVYGYELLFRSAADQRGFPGLDSTVASSQVINHGLFTMGWDTLTGGQRAFVNFTRDLLVGGYAMLLPRDLVVIEVLEDVEPDDAVLAACRSLRQAGYSLALDDFVWRDDGESLLVLAELVKVDVLAAPPAAVLATVARLRGRGLRVLAEKVETRDQFDTLLGAGCSYFQGHFFRRPAVLAGRSTPGSSARTPSCSPRRNARSSTTNASRRSSSRTCRCRTSSSARSTPPRSGGGRGSRRSATRSGCSASARSASGSPS